MAKKIKPIDEEELKVPAYLRKRGITSHARQKLLLTALDRKEAGVKPNSKRATAPLKRRQITPQPEPRAQSQPQAQPQENLPLKPKKLMQVGETTHYIENINVAIIMLNQKGVKVGDTLLIEGEEYIFTQPIEEMQIERKPVKRAKKGAHIGLKVAFEAAVDGKVYRLA